MSTQREISDYLNFKVRSGDISLVTAKLYRGDLNQFFDFVGDVYESISSVGDVSFEHVEYYCRVLLERQYSQTSVRRKTYVLKGFFSFFEIGEMFSESLIDQMSSAREVEKRTGIISEEDFQKIMDACFEENTHNSVRDAVIFLIFWDTGMPIVDLLGLNVSAFEAGEEGSVLRYTSSRDKEVVVPISNTLSEVLQLYVEKFRYNHIVSRDFDSEEALFLNHSGNRFGRNGLWLAFRSRGLEAGFDDFQFELLLNSYRLSVS